MIISGLQKTTTLDYPGKIACIVFFGGCNFRCPYCHNSSLVLESNYEAVISEEDFFKFLRKRQGILDGVCITGGEPLMQKELEGFIRKIKELGFSVKLDTNGSFPKRLKALVDKGLIEYVAMDIKHAPDSYGDASGVGSKVDKLLDKAAVVSGTVDKLKESVDFLLSGKVPYEFRTTVVKGIHEPKDMIAIGKWISGAKGYWIQNYEDSGDTICFRDGQGKQLLGFTEDELGEFLDEVKEDVPIAKLR